MSLPRAIVTFSGEPGAVIPHGVRIQGRHGEELRIVWPWWRRALVACGLTRLAPRVGPTGRMTFYARSDR